MKRAMSAVLVAVLSLPAAVVLLGLVAFAGLALHAALIALVVVVILLAGVLNLYLRDGEMIAGRLAAVADPTRPLPRQTRRPETIIGTVALRAGLQWIRHYRARSRRLQLEAAAGRTMVDALDDPILIVRADRRIARANPAATALYGPRLIGRDIGERLRNPAILSAMDRVFDGHPAQALDYHESVPFERAFEIRIKPFPVETGERPVDRGHDNEIPAVMVLVHDVTAALRTDRMRADFVANVSHELRTPLATLSGFIETLRGPARDDPDARDRFLSIMQQQTDRMARLVHDLLSLSRIEVDEHAQPQARVEISGVLSRVVQDLEMKAADRGSRLVLSMPDAVEMIQGDEDQLAQVFQNLIDNAIKYGRAGTDTEILVSTDSGPLPGPTRQTGSGRRLKVAIRDHGEGIARVHLPRLTERFYRVDPARSRAAGGTGLGLAIVKHIVARHRGRLTIDSTPDQGSTFTVLLPALDEQSAVIRPTSVHPEAERSTIINVRPDGTAVTS